MTDNLARCSFKGVDFFYTTITLSCGRRLSVNDLPYQNKGYIEDMGGITEVFNVSGYVVGTGDKPFADTETKMYALRKAFSESGFGILNLAYFGQKIRVRASNVTFTPDSGKNKCDFSCDFYPETLPIPTVNSIQYAITSNILLENVYTKFLRTLNKYVTDFTQVTGYISNALYVVRNFENMIKNFKGMILQAFNNLNLTDADERQRVKTDIDNISTKDYRSCFSVMYDVITAEKTGYSANALDVQLGYEPENPTITGSKTRKQDAINRSYISHTFKQMIICSYACLLTQTEFTSKEQAIYHRARLSDLLDAEYDYMLDDMSDDILALTNHTASYLTEVITTLSPVVEITGHNVELPALFWINRLYTVTPEKLEDMFTDLIKRNNISDPDFMPTSFKALSRFS